MNRGIAGLSRRGQWQSPLIEIVAGAAWQWAHGMGTDNLRADWLLTCVTSEFGYVAGDKVTRPVAGGAAGASGNGAAVAFRGGLVVVRFTTTTSAFVSPSLADGSDQALTNANWRATLRLIS